MLQRLIPILLWLAPAVQTLAILGVAMSLSSLRKGLGAQRDTTGVLALVAIIAIALHAGYFLAPMWWSSQRYLLAAATMIPVALVVVGAVLIVVTQTDILRGAMSAESWMRAAILAGTPVLLIAYVAPIVIMLARR